MKQTKFPLFLSLLLLISAFGLNAATTTLTNWSAQIPNAVPTSGDVILMQKGGTLYHFTPSQLPTVANLDGRGTNTTFAGSIGVATNLWQLLGTNGLPLVLVTSNQVMIVSNTLVVSARPQSTTTVPLTISGSQGQDANLFNVKDYLGNVLFAISYDGTFAEPRLAASSMPGALWTATDDIGNGAWSTNLTPQNLTISNVIASKALVLNANKQVTNAATSSAALDNFFAMGITNVLGSTGIDVGTNSGALWITNKAATTASNAVANLYGKGTNTSFYGIVTGATVRVTNLWDSSNVKYWGAIGDGSTDDTAAIQGAIDFVSSRSSYGGIVSVPNGTYRITSSLVITQQNIQLAGDNYNACIIYGTNSGMTLITVSNAIFSMRKLMLRGDASYYGTNGTTLGINLVGTPGNAGYDVDATIVDCGFLQLARGLDIHGRNVEIANSIFSTCSTNAINVAGLYGGGGSPDYRGLQISDCRFHAIGIVAPDPVVVVNCPATNNFYELLLLNNYADSCGTFFRGYANSLKIAGNSVTKCWGGIEIDATGFSGVATRARNQIVDNLISFLEPNSGANNRNALVLSNAALFQVTGNHIANPSYHGIALAGAFNNAVQNNYIADVGQAGGIYDGINVATGAQQNLISGNVVYEVTQTNAMRYGIGNFGTQNTFNNNLAFGFVTNGNEFYTSVTAYGNQVAALQSKTLIVTTNKVGIGTATPTASLDVSNAVGSAGLPIFHAGTSTGNGLTVTSNGVVGVGTSTPADLLAINTDGVAAKGISVMDGASVVAQLYDGSAVGADAFLSMYSSGVEKVRLSAFTALPSWVLSSVGIGTITPRDKLEVAGGIIISNTGSGLKIGPGNATLTNTIYASATLDFPSTVAGTVSDLSITVAGAADGDIVALGEPSGSIGPLTGVYNCWASNGVVYVRFANNNLVTAQDPASGIFRVRIDKFQ